MTSDPPETVRTRFAPSPSGNLHVGGARTALFCWAFARHYGGRFILRIEDTDQARSSDAAARGFYEDLDWLGIRWDEGPIHEGPGGTCGGGDAGPYRQSQRLELYEKQVACLIEAGHAYPAFDTPEELDAKRVAARAAKVDYRYDRTALGIDAETVRRFIDEGRPHVIRLKVPDEGEVAFDDVVRGRLAVEATELDDFIIVKADGFPTYHLAVVVDDELMGVTHVLRAEEHVKNTLKHVLLQEALGFRRPIYAHLSLIFNADGSKMSKRNRDKSLRKAVASRGIERPPTGKDNAPVIDAADFDAWRADGTRQLEVESARHLAEVLEIDLPEIDVEEFRRAGYLPEVLVNYLSLLGWSPGGDREKFDSLFLIVQFDLDRVIKSPARFDRDKLLAFNLDALQSMDAPTFETRLREHCNRYHPAFLKRLGEDRFGLFASANQTRSKTLDDPVRSCRFFVMGDDQIVYEQTKPVRKALGGGPPSGRDHLTAIEATLREVDPWTIETLETTVEAYAAAHAGGKVGKVAQPLRVAVSGGPVSPAIFETLVILGKDATLNRIERCLSEIAP